MNYEEIHKDLTKIRNLKDDWDEEGSIAYSEFTINWTLIFLQNRRFKFLEEYFKCVLDTPTISPGPDGSIDIHWDFKVGGKSLIGILVNIHQAFGMKNGRFSFFGQIEEVRMEIKGVGEI